MTSLPTAPQPRSRHGITLLEVLVACGILVVGLASLASVLPAAGTRLSQAAAEDRIAFTAANAKADVMNRGLASTSIYQPAMNGPNNPRRKACVFGALADAIDLTGTAAQGLIDRPDSDLYRRIDQARGFLSEDELVFGEPAGGDTPTNQFANLGTNGPRLYREGICWGGMLCPLSGSATPGGQAVLSIAVFSKPVFSGNTLVLTGSSVSPTTFQYTTGATAGMVDEDVRKQFLTGCTYVLALPTSGATSVPRWAKVVSSWTQPGPLDPLSGRENATLRTSYVVLDLDSLGPNAVQNYTAGTTSKSITVLVFQNLARVDEYLVTLE
jgi:hypothetical protein